MEEREWVPALALGLAIAAFLGNLWNNGRTKLFFLCSGALVVITWIVLIFSVIHKNQVHEKKSTEGEVITNHEMKKEVDELRNELEAKALKAEIDRLKRQINQYK